jgi:hypothetical protein
MVELVYCSANSERNKIEKRWQVGEQLNNAKPAAVAAAPTEAEKAQQKAQKKKTAEDAELNANKATWKTVSFYFFGAPLRFLRRRLYLETLVDRFKAPSKDPLEMTKDGVDYIYRAYDRVINKARGLLTFNGLLFTAFGLISKSLAGADIPGLLTFLGILLPLVASLPLLIVFWMSWGASQDYESNLSDLTAMVHATSSRTWLLAISIYITVGEMVVLAIIAFKTLQF